MSIIDLNAKEYQQPTVVVKCGKEEFTAAANDETLRKIMNAGKKQMVNGTDLENKLDQINLEKPNDDDIKTLVDVGIKGMAGATKDYINLADVIFEKGAGQKIYEKLGKSTMALENVMEQVVKDLYDKHTQYLVQKNAKNKRYHNQAKEVK